MPASTDSSASVHALGPGLWRMEIPLPLDRLPFVNVYAIEGDDGVYLIDAGWDYEPGFQAISSGLQSIGSSLDQVRGIVITHGHPDHLGLAERLRETTGAWLGMHPEEARVVADPTRGYDEVFDSIGRLLLTAGITKNLDLLVHTPMPDGAYVGPVTVDRLLEDGDRIDVPGWDLRAVWTPGHTPGHLCVSSRDRAVVFTGDHVLPRITPAVNVGPHAEEQPLRSFLHSLGTVADLGANTALPAHELPFGEVSARTQQIAAHHDQRLSDITAVTDDGPVTAAAIARQLRWSSRSGWDDLEPQHQRAAVLETVAHLRELRDRGQVSVAIDDGVESWRTTQRPA